jgi:4-hydroxy-tetrahydrodipicolinate reductase
MGEWPMTMPLKVGILGARGRTGSEVARAVSAAEDLELVASINRDDPIEDMATSGAQVVADFTHPDAVMRSLEFCVAHGIHAVVGTTGFDRHRLSQLRTWLESSPTTAVLVAPNFSIGALLMMRFAAAAAPFYESVEVIDVHHPDKADAPAGTAHGAAERVASARADAGMPPMPDATSTELDNARGADIAGVRVHSLRVRGVVGRVEVLLGGPGETLTIRHDSNHRVSFTPGVLTALRSVAEHPGLTVGLEHFLESVG